MQQPKRLHPALIALIVVVLIGVVASAVIIINNNVASEEMASPAPTSTTTTDSSDTDTQESTSAYADGTYDAIGSYISPGGRESIALTVTIENGIITATSITEESASGEAREYIQRFASGYEELVVGKAVDDVSLSRVAGSSLTSNGFNDALDQIKEDAAA